MELRDSIGWTITVAIAIAIAIAISIYGLYSKIINSNVKETKLVLSIIESVSKASSF